MFVDLPDEVFGGVCDEGVSLEVYCNAVRDGATIGVGGGEKCKGDAAAGSEVVGGESVELREGSGGVYCGEEAVVDGIDGEA